MVVGPEFGAVAVVASAGIASWRRWGLVGREPPAAGLRVPLRRSPWSPVTRPGAPGSTGSDRADATCTRPRPEHRLHLAPRPWSFIVALLAGADRRPRPRAREDRHDGRRLHQRHHRPGRRQPRASGLAGSWDGRARSDRLARPARPQHRRHGDRRRRTVLGRAAVAVAGAVQRRTAPRAFGSQLRPGPRQALRRAPGSGSVVRRRTRAARTARAPRVLSPSTWRYAVVAPRSAPHSSSAAITASPSPGRARPGRPRCCGSPTQSSAYAATPLASTRPSPIAGAVTSRSSPVDGTSQAGTRDARAAALRAATPASWKTVSWSWLSSTQPWPRNSASSAESGSTAAIGRWPGAS